MPGIYRIISLFAKDYDYNDMKYLVQVIENIQLVCEI